ncbi:MAG: nitrous oxide-stimulated promoter family protein [Candidatus Magnetobacterium sp. LHC-1]|nr:nitrous oxide-stimulated promoter family protein [Nitrospirota bacterium]
MFKDNRIAIEKKSVKIMIDMYCKKHHPEVYGSCSQCSELLNYSWMRLDKCVYQNDKPTCSKCPIHCYKPAMRQKIKAVMRYSGKWMIFKTPILAILHSLYGLKRTKQIDKEALKQMSKKSNEQVKAEN